MTQETYKGLCIGGPKAGGTYMNQAPIMEFPVFNRESVDIGDVYRFDSDFMPFSIWIHSTLESQKDVAREILSYYAAGKHPQEDI